MTFMQTIKMTLTSFSTSLLIKFVFILTLISQVFLLGYHYVSKLLCEYFNLPDTSVLFILVLFAFITPLIYLYLKNSEYCSKKCEIELIVGVIVYFIGLMVSVLFIVLSTTGLDVALVDSGVLVELEEFIQLLYVIGPSISIIGFLMSLSNANIIRYLCGKSHIILFIIGITLTIFSRFIDGSKNLDDIILVIGLCLDLISVMLFFNSTVKSSITSLSDALKVNILPTEIMSNTFSRYSHNMLKDIQQRFEDMAKNGKLVLCDTEALNFQKDIILNTTHEILAIHLVDLTDSSLSDIKRWLDPDKDFKKAIVSSYETLNNDNNTGEKHIEKRERITVLLNRWMNPGSNGSNYENLLKEYMELQKKLGFECYLVANNELNIAPGVWPNSNVAIEDILIVDQELVLIAVPQPNGVNLRKTQLIVYECESEIHAYKCAFNRLKEYIIRENRVVDLDNLTLTNINKPPQL